MKTRPKKRIFKKVLVPIVYGCEQSSAINAARAIAGEDDVLLMGLVYIPDSKSLSSAAVHAQEVRRTLKKLSTVKHLHRWTEVYVTHRPWNEIVKVVAKEKPDLLILEYPCQFETLETTPTEVLTYPPVTSPLSIKKFQTISMTFWCLFAVARIRNLHFGLLSP